MAHSVEEFKKHIRIYIAVFVALGILTVVTWWIAMVDIAAPWNVIVGLSIATFKAGLVMLFFMHLISEKRIIYRVLAFTFFFFLSMMLLFILAFQNDIKLRW